MRRIKKLTAVKPIGLRNGQNGLYLLMAITIVMIFSFSLPAQVPKTPNTESSVDSRMRNGATVNPATLALQMQIPLGSYQGRGGMSLPVMLSYSSKVWNIKNQTTEACGQPVSEYYQRYYAEYGNGSKSGWTSNLGTFASGQAFSRETYNNEGKPVSAGQVSKAARKFITLPDGSRHEFRKDDSLHDANETITGMYYSVDGSRLVYDNSTGTLYMPDGTRYTDSYIDRNGNELIYSGTSSVWTDTLGRSIGSPLNTPSGAVGDNATTGAAFDQTYTLPGIGGSTLTYTLRWKPLASVLTDPSQQLYYKGDRYKPSEGACGSFLNASPALFTTMDSQTEILMQQRLFNPVVLAEIVLPNNTSYKFTYNVYGEMDKVVYPTGAYDKYTYGGGTALSSGMFDDLFFKQANRGVTAATQSEDGTPATEKTWQYNGGHITAPDGSYTDRYFYLGRDTTTIKFGFDDVRAGSPYDEKVYSSSGVMMRRKLTEQAMTSNPVLNYSPFQMQTTGVTATKDPYTTKEISVVMEPDSTNALLQMTSYDYDSNADPTYFANLNVKRVKQYGYVAVDKTTAQTADITTLATYFNGQTPVRTTETDYLYDANYKARGILTLPIETRILNQAGAVVAKTQIVYDENTYPLLSYGSATNWVDPGSTYRGNPTTTRSWSDITNNQYIETHAQYDNFGNVRKSWDAKGNLSQTDYSSTYQYAYPTSVTTPVPDSSGVNGSIAAFTTSSVYDYNTGLPTSVTDANGQTSTMEYNDALLRPTKTTAPNGQQTITEYGAVTSASTRYVKASSQIDATNWKQGYNWLDGLGRTTKTQSVETTGDVFVDTEYDTMGRAKRVTNPYRSGETLQWTTPAYDSLGRVTSTTTPDGASVGTAYSVVTSGTQIGTTVTVTDQASKQRRSITNALGQLKRVDEPTDAAGLGTADTPNQSTAYSYDTLNNLTTVNQGVQTRTFTYNSLSRLLSATNPELGTTPTNGTINYQYDPNGNLTQKTDPRNISSTYTYDNLNRVKTRSYSDGTTPNVSYFYDNLTNAKGKLIKVSSSVSTTEYTAFDILGRVTGHKQTTDGTAYTTGYTYKLSGALDEETYPSTRVVKNVLNQNGDLSIVESKKNAASGYFNYAKNFTYNAAGAATFLQLGNGKWESTQFNSRLQPTQIALGTVQNGSDKLKLNYDYGSAANNGNVQSQTITVPTVGSNNGFTAVQTYTYDSLNRLASATENATPNGGSASQSWKQAFTYDRYGNRNFNESQTTMPSSFANQAVTDPTVSASNNRLTSSGYSYDNAGNTTIAASGQSFTYDGENKQTQVNIGASVLGQYYYDGDGKRIKKYVPASGETTVFVYDAAGKQIAEYSTIVYTGADAKVAYTTSDHLGSPRINTDANGAIIARHDYHPFGEEITAATTSQRSAALNYGADTVRKQFTGYERDNEDNLDFAEARYYANTLGRFTSVDPLMASASTGNPQTLNRYAYVGNNPINITDPSGLSWYFNSKIGQAGDYKWYGDNETPATDYHLVNGTSNHVYYGGEGVGYVALNPTANKFQIFDTQEAATKRVGDIYDCPSCQSLVNTVADESVRKGTTVAIAGGAAIVVGSGAGLAMAATGTAAGAAITTLGLTETAAGVGTTTAVVAATHPDEVAQVVEVAGNQLNHIFGKADHNLGSFVNQLGSRENAFNAVQQAANQALRSGNLVVGRNGILPNGNAGNIINVGGTAVRLIGGRVVNGQVQISSFSRRGL